MHHIEAIDKLSVSICLTATARLFVSHLTLTRNIDTQHLKRAMTDVVFLLAPYAPRNTAAGAAQHVPRGSPRPRFVQGRAAEKSSLDG